MAEDDLPITGPRLPVPDPTERTVEQLLRELAGLKELLLAHINGLSEKIALQARERNAYVDSAFQAAKEAAAKSEASTIKLLDQVQTILSTVKEATDERIGTLERRLTLIEGRSIGTEKGEEKHRDESARYIGAAGLLVAIIAVIAAAFTHPPSNPSPQSSVITLPPVTTHGANP